LNSNKIPFLSLLFSVLIGLAMPALPGSADTATHETKPSRSFPDWLETFRAEAEKQGISAGTLDTALAGLKPDDRIIRLDRNQPEFKKTFAQYLAQTVSTARVRKAQTRADTYRTTFQRARRHYGVQARFLLALWGVETDFGRNTGGFPVINSLATLAYDGRRSSYFSRELLDALRLVDGGAFTPANMTGSWAGAMGHFQFMPSVARHYWVDYNKNGRADLWNNPEEAILSAAHYLSGMGWKGDQTWGREVRLPKGFDVTLPGRKVRKTLPQWQALGVRRANGQDLPGRPLRASVVNLKKDGRSFVVYDNYRFIRSWNYSDYFALSVGILSDRIGKR